MPGIADIPTDFGFPTFLRVFLPGITGSMLLLYSVMPLLDKGWNFWSLEAAFFILFGGFILGVILTSFDFYIYQFYEGFRFWPGWLANWSYKRIENNFKSSIDLYWQLKDIQKKGSLTVSQENRRSSNLYKLRANPYMPESDYPLKRYPYRPTRLGNVIAEYESYPERQYGMHMRMFWHQLWFLSPEDVRNFLDLKSAIADFLLYMSFIFIIFAPIVGVVGVYQTYVKFSTQIMPHQNLVLIGVFIILTLISLFISYLFYSFAINALAIYGRNVKAFFDVYRFDLAQKLGVEIELVPDKIEREKWENLGNFLLDHKQDPKLSFPKKDIQDRITDWQ